MSTYFNNKPVWITGASSGIGKALAHELSNRGAHVILSARSTEKLQAIKTKLSHPEKAEVFTLDMLDEEAVQTAALEIQSRYPNLFMLINNAGRSQRSKVIDTDYSVYKDLMRLNYFSVVNLTKSILPTLYKNKTGHIITLSSVAGKLGAPQRSGYAASKHALHGFFDCLRSEAWHSGVIVTLICPGFVNTPIAHNAVAGDGKALGKSDPDNANGMSPDYVAKAICDAAEKKKEEVLLGGKELMGIRIKRFFPGLLRSILKKKSK